MILRDNREVVSDSNSNSDSDKMPKLEEASDGNGVEYTH